MVESGTGEDLKSEAEAEKRYCQIELDKVTAKKNLVFTELGAAVAEREKDNQSFWANYPKQAAELADADQWTKKFEERITKAESVIEQEENRQNGKRIQDSPWSKVCSCGASCPELAKFCPSCGTLLPDDNLLPAPLVVEAHRCPQCKTVYSIEFGFCEVCGIKLESCGADPKDIVRPANTLPQQENALQENALQENAQQENTQQGTVIDGNVVCPQCGTSNKARANFCGNCRARLK